MEEELRRRKEWMEERHKLSSEERKKTIREYEERKRKEYFESSPEILLAEAGINMSLSSILAGLMFTASVLFISFGREILYGDLFVTLTLVDTFFFIFGVLLLHFQVMHIRRREMYDAYHYHLLGSTFGTLGSLLMIGSLPLMAFLIRWEMGIVVSIAVVSSFLYVGYRMYKNLFSFITESG